MRGKVLVLRLDRAAVELARKRDFREHRFESKVRVHSAEFEVALRASIEASAALVAQGVPAGALLDRRQHGVETHRARRRVRERGPQLLEVTLPRPSRMAVLSTSSSPEFAASGSGVASSSVASGAGSGASSDVGSRAASGAASGAAAVGVAALGASAGGVGSELDSVDDVADCSTYE
eukprot:CAMPEP_0185705808 /NCGR_PEP_ID=MMETSP1164-20130828/20641_1 /TAXON_ID=1104430 /ORGANISM="Chrysoreinhardia sp, Strain CCMP2950" /LENGTH=177 /DNA_ID=CAMNT_0028373197 /DNA_START=749 /DNA_END=1283 /DNA_ORIENTATION=+